MKKLLVVIVILISALAVQAQKKVSESGIGFAKYEMQIVSKKDAVNEIVPPSATTDCELEEGDIVFTYTDVNFSGGKYGTLERTWTATDGCGNTATTVQFIALRD